MIKNNAYVDLKCVRNIVSETNPASGLHEIGVDVTYREFSKE